LLGGATFPELPPPQPLARVKNNKTATQAVMRKTPVRGRSARIANKEKKDKHNDVVTGVAGHKGERYGGKGDSWGREAAVLGAVVVKVKVTVAVLTPLRVAVLAEGEHVASDGAPLQVT